MFYQCRAVAAGILGDPNLVDFVSVADAEKFLKLQGGDVDILAGMTTWTMERDIAEVRGISHASCVVDLNCCFLLVYLLIFAIVFNRGRVLLYGSLSV